jgi:hypothetical protein
MDPERLIELIPARHDDQDVHVAIRVRCSVRVRAEEDDRVRVKAFRNPARELSDHTHRDARASIPMNSSAVLDTHTAILQPDVVLRYWFLTWPG